MTTTTRQLKEHHGIPIIIISAVASNSVIGTNGELPWHYPEDLQYFQSVTDNSAVIMGRKTFDSITTKLDGPLPNRTNIVLTHTPEKIPSAKTVFPVTSIKEAYTVACTKTKTDTCYVIGGASVYTQFLPIANTLLITEIQKQFTGDTTFPTINKQNWKSTLVKSTDELRFMKYTKQ